jgi:hypothetical protein
MKNDQIWYFKLMYEGHMSNVVLKKGLMHGSTSFFYCA